MAGEWQETTWGDLATLEYGKALRDYQDTPNAVRVFGTNGPIGWHDEALWRGPGVIVGRKGAYRGVHYTEEPYWVIDTAYSLRPKVAINLRWAYYQLKSIDLNNVDDGSPIPSTTRLAFYALPVLKPPKATQDRIADLLSSLDDKIELNQGMAKTLDAMARALFRSWFVDFDPVRAKAEGRPTGLPKDLAALFPNRLTDSELGQIPTGWSVGRLDDLLLLQRGFDLPATQRADGQYPVIAASGPSGSHAEFMVRGPGVTTGRSGVLGRTFFIHGDFWPLNTSLWVREFRHATPSYAFYLLSGLDLRAFNAGSAVPTLNRNHVHNLPTRIPPIDLIKAFDVVVMSLLQRQSCAEQESDFLAATRDTLLPKLISGELRIADAEKRISAA
jgi:type I restriction enzyme S subunit